MTYNYTIIRSDRRTLALEISEEAKLVIRSPRRCPTALIEEFVERHEDWIQSHIEKQRLFLEARPILTEEDKSGLIRRANAEIPPLVYYYANLMRLSPTGISITKAEKRFGSCNSKNKLHFSFRLMLYPQAAIEYVVVHELAHIVHKNHGREFYALIKSVLPDYKKREALLKK
jgi:predicted metal-dependent hydrolase